MENYEAFITNKVLISAQLNIFHVQHDVFYISMKLGEIQIIRHFSELAESLL